MPLPMNLTLASSIHPRTRTRPRTHPRVVLFTLAALVHLGLQPGCRRSARPEELLFPPSAKEVEGQPGIVEERRNTGILFLILPPRGADAAGKPVQTLSLRRYLVAGQPQWWLDAPHVRADDVLSEELFTALLGARVKDRLSGARRDAAHYGLSDDRYRVQAALSPGGYTVRLGDDVGRDQVYAARDGEPDVLLVPRRLRELLVRDRDALSLWALTVLPLPEMPGRLELGHALLIREGASWIVSEPIQPGTAALPRRAPANAVAVEGVLKALRTIRPKRLLSGSGLRFPGDFPGMKAPVVVDFNVQSAPVVIKVDGRDQLYTGIPCPHVPGEIYAVRLDAQRMCLSAEDYARLNPTFEQLRKE